MALVVHEFGKLYKALVISGASCLLACGGSALEGTGPDGAGDVEAVETTSEVEVETPEVDAVDSESGDTALETFDVETAVEVEVGPTEWEPVSLGDEGVIDDLVMVNATLGFAASGPRVLRWDGRLWAAYGAPADGIVRGVWADEQVAIAVGDDGLAAERDVAGGAWETLVGAPAVTLRAVAGRGRDDVFAVGDDGTVVHWDGSAWTRKFAKDTFDLNAMWIRPGSSGDEGVYAVGSGGQLVTFVTTGANPGWAASGITFASVTLQDIGGLADGTLIAVGDKHTITGRTPTAITWIAQVSNDERKRDLTALAVVGGAARIFGTSGAVLLGSQAGWNVDVSANTAAGVKPFAVADAAPNGPLMALAATGDGVKLADGVWSTVATRPDAMLTSFATRGDELWAVGAKGFLAKRGAQGWTAVPSGTSADLYAITEISEGALIAVGARGAILKITQVDGVDTVTALASQVLADLYGVAASPNGVVACGRGGTLVAIGGDDAVSLLASTTAADLKAVALGGDGRMWVGGVFGTLLRLSAANDAPTLMMSTVGGSLNGLAAFEDGVLVVGDNGVVLRANATTVVLENEAPGAFLYGVAAANGAAIAAGANGLVLVRKGATWIAENATERGATFDAVYIAADGSEALVGGVLRLMHAEKRKLALVEGP